MTSITKFYSGRTILITGGTGFMGKVLLEKMIRSLPDIKTIYVLLREKRGMSPEDRVRALTSKEPFTLNNIDAENFKKIVAIHGDITKEDLGISSEDKQKLIEEVSVVFHIAASISMNLNLKDAVVLNTLGAQRILNLCTELKDLKAVVHLSTAYCNVDVEYMEEKVYDIHLDPYKIMDMVEWMDDESLEAVQKSIIKPHPNTYTFSKRLAEMVAWNMGKKLPVCIARPSIVLPSYCEPAPGWVDSLNGPAGLISAAGKGVLQSILADKYNCPQVIPVDLAINALLIMAYVRTTENFTETPVYNLTQADIVTVSWNEAVEKLRKMAVEHPFKQMLWYPGGAATTSVAVHTVKSFFFHTIPAYFIDFLLFLFLQKPFLVNVQNRLSTGLNVLSYFVLRKFEFTNEKTVSLITLLDPNEQTIFPLVNIKIDVDDYLKNAFTGTKRFCFHEDLEDVWYTKVLIHTLYMLECMLKFWFYYGIIWLILKFFGMTYVMSWSYWL